MQPMDTIIKSKSPRIKKVGAAAMTMQMINEETTMTYAAL